MRAFVQPETLEGRDQYFCEKCNKKCDAHKVSRSSLLSCQSFNPSCLMELSWLISAKQFLFFSFFTSFQFFSEKVLQY